MDIKIEKEDEYEDIVVKEEYSVEEQEVVDYVDAKQDTTAIKSHLIKFEITEIEDDAKSRKIRCQICWKSFDDKASLKSHNAVHQGEVNFHCAFCSKGFARKNSLRQHMIIHVERHPVACQICHKTYKNSKCLKQHMHRHLEKRHECTICGMRFIFLSGKKSHILKVHKGKDFQELFKNQKCKKCGKKFYRKHDYITHLSVHSDDRPFQCTLCSKRFKAKSYLRIHTKNHHSDEKKPNNISCHICNKCFNRKADLDFHTILHTQEKDIQCPFCHKKFAHTKYLKNHVKGIHKGVTFK